MGPIVVDRDVGLLGGIGALRHGSPDFGRASLMGVKTQQGPGNRGTSTQLWRVLGLNQRRLSRRFYRPPPRADRPKVQLKVRPGRVRAAELNSGLSAATEN
jgi:hypothetical protein